MARVASDLDLIGYADFHRDLPSTMIRAFTTVPVDVGYEKVDQVAVIHLVGIFCWLQVATM